MTVDKLVVLVGCKGEYSHSSGQRGKRSCESFYCLLVLYIFPGQSHATPVLAIVTGICMLFLLLVLAALNVLVSDVLPLALVSWLALGRLPPYFDSALTPRLLLSQMLFMVALKPLLHP